MMKKLTGRKRYRIENRLFRSSMMVLQVEEIVSWEEGYDDFVGLKTEAGQYTHWRDARLEDMRFGENVMVGEG